MALDPLAWEAQEVSRYEEESVLFVPDGHPLVGTTLDIPAESGATDSGWAKVRFTTPAVEGLRQEMQKLRAALDETWKQRDEG